MYRWLLFRLLRFTATKAETLPAKCVIALAPHTSNWDFIVGILFSRAVGLPCSFVMKSEWFFWPLGKLFRRLGGIPVRRDRHHGLTDQLAEVARESETFRLCITPEGTRGRQTQWKRGFYFIALKAQVPILLCGLDYKRRHIECTRLLTPTGDVEREMNEIKAYFAPFAGKHPERFTVEE